MDADLCRGVRRRMFGDPAKVRFVPLTAVQRFTALQSGEIDVLIRQTTLTMTRDTTLGLRMVIVNLYDGHGFMVRKDANISDPKGMDGMTICLSPGTTNELVTADWFRANNCASLRCCRNACRTTHLPAGRAVRRDRHGCDAARGAAQPVQQPGDFVILPQRFSKEPYGPVVRRDDQEWFDVVRWTVSALIQAEELGVTSQNAEAMKAQPEPRYPPAARGGSGARQRAEAGPRLGLSTPSAQSAITASCSSVISARRHRSGWSGG